MRNLRNLIGAFLIASGIFLTWGWTLPGYQAANLLKGLAMEKEAELVKKQEIMEKLKSLNRQIESRADEITRLSQVVPITKSVPEVISALENAGALNGMNIFTITSGDRKGDATSKFDSVFFEVEAEGSYLSLVNFLQSVESNLRILDVSSIDVNPPSESISSLLTMKIKMNAHVLKEKVVSQRNNVGAVE